MPFGDLDIEEEDKEALLSEIDEAIEEVALLKEIAKVKSLSRYDPQRVARILYLHSVGVSQTQMIRKYGLNRNAIINTLADYGDRLGGWRSIGGKISARSFLSLASLLEDLVEKLHERMDSADYQPTFRDLRDLSFAKEQAWRMSVAARDGAMKAVPVQRMVSQADYEETLKAAQLRVAEAKAG